MSNRRIVFNNSICDGSSHCWFLKENNCPAKVFQYDSEAAIINRLKANVDLCIGCERCDGHCPAARLAVDDEREICMAALMDLEAELGVKTSDGLFAEPVINKELNIYVKDKDIRTSVNKTIEVLSNYPNRVQLIELYSSALCALVTVPYENFYKAVEGTLTNGTYHNGIDRRVIYTYEDKDAVKEFLYALNIDLGLSESAPLIIVYLDGRVLAVCGHGEINLQNFTDFKNLIKDDMENQLRKNNL